MSSRIVLDAEFCKGCRLCLCVCPKEVYSLSAQRNPKGFLTPVPVRVEDCAGCLICEMICPDMAITVIVEGKERKKDAS